MTNSPFELVRSHTRRIVPGRRRSKRALFFVVSLGTVVGVGAWSARRFDREIDRAVADIRADARSTPERRIGDAASADLPAPIERYLETVFGGDRPTGRLVRLRQRGEFRLGGPDAPWRPMRATQHVTIDPPGFVWDATIEVAPLIPVRVLDRYANGNGVLQAKLRSVIPVASAGPSPEMNAGELTRYLAEAVWYPAALLPGHGVEWDAIDDSSARATLEHRGVTASLVFHVDDRGLVTRVTTDRYRQEEDAYAPWTGRFWNYAERNGTDVPLTAAVEWNLPGGDLPYWRARVQSLEDVPFDGVETAG